MHTLEKNTVTTVILSLAGLIAVGCGQDRSAPADQSSLNFTGNLGVLAPGGACLLPDGTVSLTPDERLTTGCLDYAAKQGQSNNSLVINQCKSRVKTSWSAQYWTGATMSPKGYGRGYRLTSCANYNNAEAQLTNQIQANLPNFSTATNGQGQGYVAPSTNFYNTNTFYNNPEPVVTAKPTSSYYNNDTFYTQPDSNPYHNNDTYYNVDNYGYQVDQPDPRVECLSNGIGCALKKFTNNLFGQ